MVSPAPDPPAFAFDKIHGFPPLFTLQPNMTTRAAQLERWSDMVRAYCAHHRVFRLATHDATGAGVLPVHAEAIFANARIGRRLDAAGVRAVMAHMVAQGRAEAVGGAGADDDAAGGGAGVFFVWWRTPDDWAEAVRAWVDATAQAGSVVTLFEMTEGEAARGSELAGLDGDVLKRALGVLERQKRAQMISTGGGEMGVKFFAS